MFLSVCIPTFRDYDGLWSTVRHLHAQRLQLGMVADVEIVVSDTDPDGPHAAANAGFVQGFPNAVYVPLRIPQGTALAKEHAIQAGSGQYRLCLDSHVDLRDGVLAKILEFWQQNPDCRDLLQGPNLHGREEWDDGTPAFVGTHMEPRWGTDGNFGTWAVNLAAAAPEAEPFEIPLSGTGLFMFKADAWLGFDSEMRGFGAEEGAIHQAYRDAGRRCLCLPWLQWIHRYGHINGSGYAINDPDRCRNYLVTWSKRRYPSFSGIADAYLGAGRLSIDEFNKISAEFGIPALTGQWRRCSHRTQPLKIINCNLCGGGGKPMQVFGCALHGECSIGRQHSAVRSCLTCPDADDGTPAAASRQTITLTPRAKRPRLRVGFCWPTMSMGGVSRVVTQLAEARHAEYLIARVLWSNWTAFDRSSAQALLNVGVQLSYAGSEPKPGTVPWQQFATAAEGLQELLDNVDVVLPFGFTDAFGFGEVATHGKPVIISSHGTCGWTERTLAALEPFATHAYAVSHNAARLLPERFRNPAAVIHNGVDLNRCAQRRGREAIRAEWGLAPEQIAVGFVGRLAYDKRPLAIAEVVQQLGANYRAIYVGEGYQAEQIRAAAKDLIGDQALFVGQSPHIGDTLAALDVVVQVSPHEGMSMLALETWAAGRPFVSTLTGALPELEAEYGPLCVPVSIDDHATALAEAVVRAQDPLLQPRWHAARRMTFDHFSTHRMAERFAEYLRGLMVES